MVACQVPSRVNRLRRESEARDDIGELGDDGQRKWLEGGGQTQDADRTRAIDGGELHLR